MGVQRKDRKNYYFLGLMRVIEIALKLFIPYSINIAWRVIRAKSCALVLYSAERLMLFRKIFLFTPHWEWHETQYILWRRNYFFF